MKISREVKLGLWGVLTLFLFVWGISYLKGKDIFSKKMILFAEYDNVAGLVETNPVAVSGVKIGQVEKIAFHPEGSGRIIISMILKKAIGIPKNSVAHLTGADFMGFREIELIFGDSQEMVSNGDTLASITSNSIIEDVSRQFGPLKEQAETLIARVDSVLMAVQQMFNENTGNYVNQALKSLKNTMLTVEQQTDQLKEIITDAGSISSNLKDNNENISNIIQNFSSMSDTLASLEIGRAIAEINSTIESLSMTLNKIQRGEGSIGLLVNDEELYRNLEGSSKRLELLLEDIRQNPRRYINIRVFGKD